MATTRSGNEAWVSRPFRLVNADLTRSERAGRGQRLAQLLAEEREESGETIAVNNSSRVRAALGNEEAENIIRRITTPPSSPPSSPAVVSNGDTTQPTLTTYYGFSNNNDYSSDNSSSAISSPILSSDGAPPAKKRRVIKRSAGSLYVPYFKFVGKNGKGVEIFRCLLRPSSCASSKGSHPRDIACHTTSNLRQHLSTWHLPALSKIQEMSKEGIYSNQAIESRIFELFGETVATINGIGGRLVVESTSFANLVGSDNVYIHRKKTRLIDNL